MQKNTQLILSLYTMGSLRLYTLLLWTSLLSLTLSLDSTVTPSLEVCEANGPCLSDYPFKCHTDQWLSQNGSVPGYHVLCITKDLGTNALEITFYRDGEDTPTSSGRYISSSHDIPSLRVELERILRIQYTDSKLDRIPNEVDRPNKWGLFNPLGDEVTDYNQCEGTLLVFVGGVFIYPAIRIGFERDVLIRTDDGGEQWREFKLTTLSTHPVVLKVENFIMDSDCDHIVSISSEHMKLSGVSHMHNTKGDASQWRTSTTHWLRQRDDVIKRIETHCSKLLHIPMVNQELIQVLKYEPTQQYDSHWDYFDPSLYRGTAMERKIRGGRNRVATLFWYMSNVTEGGWTYFPRSGKKPAPKSFKLKVISDCDDGLKVEPQKGAVILFYSMTPDGEVDPYSLHGACPVGEGNIKWGANIWYWTKESA